MCSDDGLIVDCNPQATKLLGASVQALRGQALAGFVRQPAAAGASAVVGLGLCDGQARVRRGAVERAVDLHLHAVDAAEDRRWMLHLRNKRSQGQAEEKLSHLTNFDSLTGLPNRSLFRDRLGQAMARAERSGQPLALMIIDLDRFKLVNDSLGHEVGDSVLKHVSSTLTQCLRNVDSVVRLVDASPPVTLSHLGGDEFTVILEAIESAEDAALVARRIIEGLLVPFRVGKEEIVVSGSIGISMYPTDEVDLDGLVRHAGLAMYRSKSLGRGTYSFFSDDLNAAVSARLRLEGGLRHAIERNEFQLYFQPKANLCTGEVTGVEALLRWDCPGEGVVPPDRFIGVLEDTGMILPVGAWVIRTACAQLGEWDRQGLPPLRMAVNLSARQFHHLHLASMIEDSLREHAIDAQRLEIELTESLLMEDNEATRNMLESFARMGLKVAIDDFGTGHSSLTYLKRFSIDTLKIDRSFVSSLPSDSEDVAITTAVIALGRSMQMKVVAEGVETQAQADLLRKLGCDEMQGYLLARPMPAADLAQWLVPHLRTQANRRRSYGRAGIERPMSLEKLPS